MNTEDIVRGQLKQEVKRLFSHKWGVAILMALGIYIFDVLSTMVQSYYQSQVQLDNGNNVVTNFSGKYQVIIFLLSTLSTFVAVAASYGYLDWLNSNQQPSSPSKTSFMVFTKKYFTSTLAIFVLKTIFIFFWSLLLVIPGIIKGYSYSQAFLVYKSHVDAGDQNVSYLDCITESRRLMNGHKWDYFVLQISFIGWYLLGFLTLGIGLIWVVPYASATYSNFYRHLIADANIQLAS